MNIETHVSCDLEIFLDHVSVCCDGDVKMMVAGVSHLCCRCCSSVSTGDQYPLISPRHTTQHQHQRLVQLL